MSSTTRERIVDEALRLFSDHGYKATTIARIESAAGLTPGAGGIYHHFHSKEAVLEAGIERQLSRLQSLGAIRQVFTSLGDLRAELTLVARYVLAQLDEETQLIRLLAQGTRGGPAPLATAAQRLADASFAGFSGWIAERAPGLTAEEASALAASSLGALLSSRLLRDVIGIAPSVEDAALVDGWVRMMEAALRQ